MSQQPSDHDGQHSILKTQRKMEKSSSRIIWDEENLAHNDINKSATMKITEPKTPFHHYIPEDDEDDDEEEIFHLPDVLKIPRHNKKSEWSESDEDEKKHEHNKNENASEVSDENKVKFREKVKQHYKK